MAGSNEIQGSMAGSSGALGQIAGTVLGLMTANYNDTRQKRMNAELMKQQTEAGKDMGRFNRQQALELWKDTSYSAQRAEMEKAGLNPGLMYGSAGSGGTTSGAAAQMPSTSTAPQGGGEIGMGMQMGLQAQMMAAQTALMRSQAKNVDADTKEKLTGTEGETGTAKGAASLENIAADTANKKTQNAILQLDTDIKDIERQVLTGTKENAISLIESAARKAYTEAGITEQTAPEVIKQVETGVREQALRIAAQEKGLIKTQADIDSVKQGITKMMTEVNNMVQNNQREWGKMSQKDKEIMIQQKIQEIAKQNADFNTSLPQHMKQWSDLIMEVLTLGIAQ